jgi:hypothetical protein
MSEANTDKAATQTDNADKTKADTVTWEGPGPVKWFVNKLYTNTFGWVSRQYNAVCEAIYADDLLHYEAMERAGVIKRPVAINLD